MGFSKSDHFLLRQFVSAHVIFCLSDPHHKSLDG
jgi:hypothetical protein